MEHLAMIIVAAHIAAAIALLNGVLVTIAQGNVAARAIEAIARQPEAKGSITSAMFVGIALAETTAIYGVLIAIIMLFANPLVNIFLQNAANLPM